MNTEPEVMADLGGTLSRAASDAKLTRYRAALDKSGFGRWVVERPDGALLGYCGVLPVDGEHPLGAHYEIGWRLVRSAWGFGYASEAAIAALNNAFDRSVSEVLSYTAQDNLRSQAVMARIGLERRPDLDFEKRYASVGLWKGLVWSAGRETFVTPTPPSPASGGPPRQ